MSWKLRWWILFVAGIPALTGYPRLSWILSDLPGIDLARLFYAIGIYGLIGICCGPLFLAGVVSAASLIVLPLIFFGAGISFTFYLTGLSYPGGPFEYSPHYVALAVNMLGVIPLALSLVLSVPYSRLEAGLLRKSGGVSRLEKYAMMALRVFNHIAFSVIPAALEVVREEGKGALPGADKRGGFLPNAPGGSGIRIRMVVEELIHLTSTCICSALRFIPLWAVEIAQLPERDRDPSKRD